MDEDSTYNIIIREICRQCTRNNIEVHQNFLIFYVKLLAFDPKWNISPKTMDKYGDMKGFVECVVSNLQRNDVNIITLKTQYYFLCNFDKRKEMVRKNREELMLRLKPLRKDIIRLKMTDNAVETEKMYKCIGFYVTLAAGLGNPTREPVYKEFDAALKSILDEKELAEFLRQPTFQKKQNLKEFTKLCTGIRLFHRHTKRGGEGIEDLPQLLSDSVEATKNLLQAALMTIMDRVNMFTTAIDNVHVIRTSTGNIFSIVWNLPEGVQKSDLETVKSLLILYRQYEVYVRKLMAEVESIEMTALDILIELNRNLMELENVCCNRIAIPAFQVFPYFMAVCDLWFDLQDQIILTAKLNQIFSNLKAFAHQVHFNEKPINLMVGKGGPITDAERLVITAGCQILQKDGKAAIIPANCIKNIDKFDIQYLGFCAWKLVESDGALIPGNPQMGIAKTMHMHYVFSTLDAAESFGQDPERYVLEAVQLVRRKPELINLLRMKQHLIAVQDFVNLVAKPPLECLIREHVGEQTEVHHIVEPTWDRKYMWNIWDLKREALMLAQISKCKTVSCQTLKTHFRFGVTVQTHEMRDKNVQTMRDNYSNVPKPSTFIAGLRGRKDDKQVIVDLTRPVEE